MGKTTEAFTVPEGTFECAVEELHARYLGREVMAVDPKTGLRVFGELKSIKFSASGDNPNFFNDDLEATLRISGYKLKVQGGFKLVFVDGSGAESLP